MKIKSILIITSLLIPSITFAINSNCPLSTGINVQTAHQRLYVCEHSNVINEFKISIGRNGIGKKQSGDNKTPVGLYKLASPRQSNEFGIFIPIQYPTNVQLLAGYTGKDVGIHGPFHLFNWLGSLNTLFNWTQGCIAVGNNEQMDFLAKWVKDHPQVKIIIS